MEKSKAKNPMPLNISRDPNIDSLKGFLILSVIIGHWTHSFLESINFDVYYYHVPMFLGVSLFFIPDFNKRFLLKRMSILLIPYLLWSISPGLYTILLHPSTLFADRIINLGNILMGNFHYLKSIIWFLPCLFTANILFSIYKNFKNSFTPIFITLFIISFIYSDRIAIIHEKGFIPFGIDIFIYFFPYFLSLFYVYQKKSLFIIKQYWIFLFPIILSAFLIFKFEPIKVHTDIHHQIDLAQFSVPTTIIGYFSMTLLSISILLLFCNAPALKALSIIGYYSMPIYFFHFTIMKYIKMLYDTYLLHQNSISSFFIYLSCILIIILLSILVNNILFKISKQFKYFGIVPIKSY